MLTFVQIFFLSPMCFTSRVRHNDIKILRGPTFQLASSKHGALFPSASETFSLTTELAATQGTNEPSFCFSPNRKVALSISTLELSYSSPRNNPRTSTRFHYPAFDTTVLSPSVSQILSRCTDSAARSLLPFKHHPPRILAIYIGHHETPHASKICPTCPALRNWEFSARFTTTLCRSSSPACFERGRQGKRGGGLIKS